MTMPLLSLQDVSIKLGDKLVVDRLNLDVAAGERVALVGESGSGKTVSALSILRLLPHAHVTGRILFRGEDLLAKSEAEIRAIRGADIAMIFQEPMSALNPVFTIGSQIAEALVVHEGLSRAAARERAVQLLALTRIREPERRIDSYPHQLSGGQRQRAVIAMALACRPRLLIADEPTTALDLTIRAKILRLLLDLADESAADGSGGMGILLITHDLPLVRKFAQRVAVMERGRLVEAAETADLFEAPQHPYSIKLLSSTPKRNVEPIARSAPVVLQTDKLRVEYPKAAPGWRGAFGLSAPFVAVEGADLTLRAGETVGIVGESGSGKSTLAQAILNLTPARSGEIRFEGRPVVGLDKKGKRSLRSRLQVVFQDPFGSLSPQRTIEQIVGEGLDVHQPELPAEARRVRIVQVLADVGLPETALDFYPHQFSGGQRQRIAIARALVVSPRVVILDEPTSALDLSIQRQVLDLLAAIQKKYGLSYVLISHDLAVINAMAHRLYVMHEGRIVESGETVSVINQPAHEYTRSLIQASDAVVLQ